MSSKNTNLINERVWGSKFLDSITELNIAIQDLQINRMPCYLLPLCLFENCCVLILNNNECPPFRATLYDGRDNTVKHSKLSSNIRWVSGTHYVQSLVSPRRY